MKWILLIILALALSACGSGQQEPKPVATVDQVAQAIKESELEHDYKGYSSLPFKITCTADDAEGRHFACIAQKAGVVLYDYTDVICDGRTCNWMRYAES